MTQALRDIAVLYNTSEEGLRVLDLAASLAAAQGALLIGLCAVAAQKSSPHADFALGDATTEMLGGREATIAKRLLQAGKALDQASRRHGIDIEFRAIQYTESRLEMAMHSLYCDLLIVSEGLPDVPLEWSSLAILQQTGVPVLLVPAGWRGSTVGQHIVLGWNGSRQARRAVADAMPLLASATAVDLLVVDAEKNRQLHGEQPGTEMAAYLARHGAKADLFQLRSEGRSTAEAIVEHALQGGADLIVIGAYSHSRLSEVFLGGVTRSLLKGVNLPLFISH